ncbi:MAG: FAD-dependent oxidoreductase [Elusimicrobia bacterium]|nr:FAD-dependent oxidoreductase [Elusimicrobiota bacterium]
MKKTDVLILGGGLGGLSTAYHLDRLGGRLSYLIAEAKRTPGGLAGSVRRDGFTFDHTGHLLHLHDPYGKTLIMDLLKGNLSVQERNAWIYIRGAYARYPFQANTFGMPWKVVEDCVAGYVKTLLRPRPVEAGLSFREWSLRTFGEGISKHFMFPYNEKLWRTPLSRMTTEWQGRFVPKPAPEEVLYGALSDQRKFFGYNATFRYPVRGGIQALPDALAARVSNLHLGCVATKIDLREKVAVIAGLGEVRYEKLVSTLPLVDLLDIASPLPPRVQTARRKLRYNTVFNLNIGVARRKVSDKHWVYFPEASFPFYRAGFSSNFSAAVAPEGATSMYIEVARKPGERVDLNRLEGQILSGLRRCGLLKASDKILTRVWLPIPCAYVVYDFDRTQALATIFPFLRDAGVSSIGRYGGWKYSFMEETILDGKRCAERLLGRERTGEERRMTDRPFQAELKPLK